MTGMSVVICKKISRFGMSLQSKAVEIPSKVPIFASRKAVGRLVAGVVRQKRKVRAT